MRIPTRSRRTAFVRRLLLLFSLFAVGALPVMAAAALSAQQPAANFGGLHDELAGEDAARLAAQALAEGDAARGAIVFYSGHTACARCHAAGEGERPLGPDLAAIGKEAATAHLVESLLDPSKVIRKGFETVVIAAADGRSYTGLLVEDGPASRRIRDAGQNGQIVEIAKQDTEAFAASPLSIMPGGLANQLASRQQFYDLVRYLREIADGGPSRALQLRPDPALYAEAPLPEYEGRVDHAGMIGALDAEAFRRGEAIYGRLCVNCHGTREQPGTLPTSLRFATGKFKNGSDPFAMYQTLTRGFGMMVPQAWMVPQQKYDVIHYLREAYLKPHNSSQYAAVDATYLAKLPKGDTRGPAPLKNEPWVAMNYGPTMTATYEIPASGKPADGAAANFAYKGIAVRLDSGPGGVSRGRHWMIFDHDTMRMAAAFSGEGFIDWRGINFDGAHNAHPKLVGRLDWSNPVGPGWANPADGSFRDPRLRGRDERPYGPLPRSWARYRGLYHHNQQAVVSYTVGRADVLESPNWVESAGTTVYTRAFNIGPRDREMILQVARHPDSSAAVRPIAANGRNPGIAFYGGAASGPWLAAGTAGENEGLQWRGDGDHLRLRIPAGERPIRFTLWAASAADEPAARRAAAGVVLDRPDLDLAPLTKGGPPRWPVVLATPIHAGSENGPFAVDTLVHPDDNPWFCQMRLTGFDFMPDGDRMAVCSWDGDVWMVGGLTGRGGAAEPPKTASGAAAGPAAATRPGDLAWRRIASGLFQPLGLKVVDGVIYVTCRDQLVILRDLNGDGETDFYECFNNDHQVTEHFHEFAMGLQVDGAGNFYYAKSARHALRAIVPHHGTLLRVSADGSRTDILATGFRAANGVCLNPDGTFFVTDQEGHWTPKNRVNWVEEGGFYGNMFGYHDVTDSSDSAMRQPLCWITNALDRSPAELLWVHGSRWGPLAGSLLNLSYGAGRVFVVPHEKVAGQLQGGLCALPIPTLPTGVMRGRFHPGDGQLYACGMFAWGGNQTKPGGFYRVRYTGRPVHLPVGLNAKKTGMAITFSGELDGRAATETDRYAVTTWSLKRTAGYGSKHLNEKTLIVAAARLAPEGRTVVLDVPNIEPTWCMEIKYRLRSASGEEITGTIHNTVHQLGE
jgi:putative heme-binding domain-containing protein